MHPLTKLIVFFAVLGVVGGGLFFFPQSPLHHTKIRTIIIERQVEVEPSSTTESMSEQSPEAGVSAEQVVQDAELEVNE